MDISFSIKWKEIFALALLFDGENVG